MATLPDQLQPIPHRSRGGLRDVALLGGIAIVGAAAVITLDGFGRLDGWLRWWGVERASELTLILCLLALAASAIAWRRVRELSLELRQRRWSEALFADFADASSDWLWEMDPDLRFRLVCRDPPPAARRFAERMKDGLVREVDDDAMSDEAWGRQWADIGRKKPFRGLRFRVQAEGGETRYLQLGGKPVVDEEGRFAGYRGTGTDVTSEVAAEARARHLALHDPLSGLPNRILLRDRLQQAIAIATRRGQLAALLCLDLDRFKEVNDTLGHAAGDQLITIMAARLQGAVREADTVARIGGDEFAIVQIGVRDTDEIVAICERLLHQIATPVELGGRQFLVSVSIGVALIPLHGGRAEELLKNADIALYRAKEEGRSTFCLYRPEMGEALQGKRALEAELRHALAAGELGLHYQPQIEARSRRLVGLEALLRWHHPERGEILPGEFLAQTEASGLILPLGEWVLRTACRQALAWPGLRMSVNLSAAQFRRRDLVEFVREVLEETGLEPSRLELEITENALLHDPQGAFEVLEGLRRLGVRVAIDDFGTGYSSFSYLQRFTFDKIKIDRSFVARLGQADDSEAIVRAIIGLGRSLGLSTCAEGVETVDQQALLAEEGCVELQGFLFCRPLEAAEIDGLIAEWGGIAPGTRAQSLA
jgi:diguanylate cyclase (GGDEF)-like protein